MSGGYKISDPEGIYFCTFATVGWIDLFTRQVYRDIVVQNLRFCQEQKGLQLFAWVIMSNHLHLIAAHEKGNLSGLLRDFKSFTSKQLYQAIHEEPESRRNWMLRMFEWAGRHNPNNKDFQVWQQDNHPKQLLPYDGSSFMRQKLDYLHQNPVRAGWVDEPEEYVYSSARNYADRPGLLKVDFLY